MRALDVNLASQPFRNNTLLWIGYGIGFTVLVGLLASNVSTWLEHRGYQRQAAQRLGDMESKMAELDRRDNVARVEQAKAELDLEALSIQALAANEVIERKAFSWTRLFNRIEETIPWNVHLTSVRPLFRSERDERAVEPAADEPKSIVVAVEGYAKDLGAFLALESALIDHPSFDFPEPKRHQRNERNEIVFELDFTYYPDAVEDVPETVDTAGAAGAVDPDATAPDGVAATVGGDGPPDEVRPDDPPPLDGTPDAAAQAAAASPPAAEVAGGVAEGVPGAEPGPVTDPALRPGQEPPRIPPPYATAPDKGDQGDTNRRKGRKPPPRQRPADEDQADEGGGR